VAARRLGKLLLVAMIAAALLLGVLLGAVSRVTDTLFGSGPEPDAIAQSSLQSMQAQNRLVPFVARYVTVVTSRQSRLGLSAERTLILPGLVRYEVDLSRLGQEDVRWNEASRTLTVRIPDVEIAGPEVDLAAAREYGAGQLLTSLTGGEQRLDQSNRAAAVADLRRQAAGEVPMRLAREAARNAIERSFAMPLAAAGFDDVRVVARFAAEEGSADRSVLDRSRDPAEVLRERREAR
jgi:hypothetical protein